MQTVAVFIQSVILQAFGTESGSFMRESPEAGDPWIKGKVERQRDISMFFFCVSQVHLLECSLFWGRLLWLEYR